MKAKANYHTHTTWCDGSASVRETAEAAVAKGFATLGFSSHAMLPVLPSREEEWTVTAAKAPFYAADVRAAAREFAPRLRILCGVEADYVRGKSEPSRAAYAAISPDYIIGSVHYLAVEGGRFLPFDHSPQILADGIRDFFGGDSAALVKAYFAAVRESLSFDFDIVGHPDLVRKFNVKHPFFDENAPWYAEELRKTADAIAASGKIVEVNTGAIARGWLDEAYPSPAFRKLLRERGVRFVLDSDAHRPDALDAAFDRYSDEESYETI